MDEGNDKIQSLINTSRDGFIEDTDTVEKFNKWVKDFLRKVLKEESQKRVKNKTREILESENIDYRLNSLPNSVKSKAKDMISTLVSKMKEQDDNKDVLAFANLVLQYFESNILKELLDNILNADSNDIEKLANLIAEWGLKEVAGVTSLVKQQIEIIKKLEELINKVDTLEIDVHKLFEKNLWLLNDRYKLWQSDRNLKTILDGKIDKEFRDQQDLRPDLVCLTNSSENPECIIIEFKRPKVKISMKNLTQTLSYKAVIQKQALKIKNVTTFVIGKEYDESVRAIKDEQEKAGNFLMSYVEVLSKAEKRFSDILKILEGQG